MKRYLLYVGIVFVIQVLGFWLFLATGAASDFFKAISYLFYALPSAFIMGAVAYLLSGVIDLEPSLGFTLTTLIFIAFTYSLVIAALICLFTYSYKMGRDRSA